MLKPFFCLESFSQLTGSIPVIIDCALSCKYNNRYVDMSFLGGAECSTAGNPLTQFTKHVHDDKSLQRDRLVGRGPGGMQEGMRTQRMGIGQDKVRITAPGRLRRLSRAT